MLRRLIGMEDFVIWWFVQEFVFLVVEGFSLLVVGC